MATPPPAVETPLRAFVRSLRIQPATAGALTLLVAAASSQGGYFPGSWGWLVLACSWASLLTIVLRRNLALSRPGLAMLLLLGCLAIWTAASSLWSSDVTQSVLEARRALVYVAAVLAALLLGRDSPNAILRGTWAAAALVATYALLTRLVPDRLGVTDPISGYRLSTPIGYWNATGLFAAIGILLALGLAARERRAAIRVAAAVSVVPLATALYFTFGRGAWVALAGGLLVAFALDRRRLQLLAAAAAVAPFATLAVATAAAAPALTTTGSAFEEMVAQGHAAAIRVAALAAGAGAASLLVVRLERVVAVPLRLRRTGSGAVVVVLVVAVALAFARFGSPLTLAQEGWEKFASPPPAAAPNLNERLFQLSGTGRVAQWRVAWDQAREHPWVGSGAGTYERHWNRERPSPSKIRDAHSLYLEVLAELGPLGLALLLAALSVPLVVGVRSRDSALVPAALGAYAAYLLHASVDWDWEITSVTLAALACGVAVAIAGGARTAPDRRPLLLVASVVLAALAVAGIAERTALARLESASPAHAESAADRAARLAPWSTEPWRILARAQISERRFADARVTVRKAIERDDGDWRLWLDLARAADGRERANALDAVERLNPRSPELARFRALLASLSAIEPS